MHFRFKTKPTSSLAVKLNDVEAADVTLTFSRKIQRIDLLPQRFYLQRLTQRRHMEGRKYNSSVSLRSGFSDFALFKPVMNLVGIRTLTLMVAVCCGPANVLLSLWIGTLWPFLSKLFTVSPSTEKTAEVSERRKSSKEATKCGQTVAWPFPSCITLASFFYSFLL